MDRDVGRIADLLGELGIDENTLVIFTSDNGPHGSGGTLEKFNAAGPLRAKKGSLYEGGIRVPMVARWPGKIRPGTTSNLISGFQDMLPTFAELASAAVPKPIDGISFVPTLLGRPDQKEHEYLYWELGSQRAVRLGRFKAVQSGAAKNAAGPIELFDLAEDLAEQRNIAADRPEIVEKVRTVMNESHTYSEFFDLRIEK
jgi:arylsulfatase A-like enzyme